MAIDDLYGEIITEGTWLYDGVVPMRTAIVACNFDHEHYFAMDEWRHVRETCDPDYPLPPPPRAPGPDGVFYHAEGSPGFDTVAEAKAWADSQPWGPVHWD